MLKSFKSFKSFKGNSNLLFQILCKSTMILLYEYEEYVKKLLNRIFVASNSLSINSESHSSAFDKKVLLLSEGVRRNALRVKHPKCPHTEEIVRT